MRVRYTLPAFADLVDILDYLALRSPQTARRVQTRVSSVLDLLRVHPFVGMRTDDPTIRRLVVTPYPYFVFYEVTKDKIVIHNLRHSARDPSMMPGSERP